MTLKGVQPKSIFCGDAHSACVSLKNTLYTWGKGSYGRLGHGFTKDVYKPEQVEELVNKYIEVAYLGAYHTFAVTTDQEIFAWGGCSFGKLGVRGKNSGNLILPTLISKFTSKSIIELSAGPYHTMALNSEGKLYAWGNGRQGKLGIKSTNSVDEPTKITNRELFGDTFHERNFNRNNSTTGVKQPRNMADDDLMGGSDLFNKFNEFMVLQPKSKSNKSMMVIQIAILEKQTIFLTDAGELYGCGSSDKGILGKYKFIIL